MEQQNATEQVVDEAVTRIDVNSEDIVKNPARIYTNQTAYKEPAAKLKQKCSICQKDTTSRCGKCKLVYYCSSDCQKKDYPSHKKTCAEPKIVVPSEVHSYIELNDKFYDAIYQVMSQKYVHNGSKGVVKAWRPVDIRIINKKKHFLVQEIKQGLTLEQYKQLYLDKKLPVNDFWSLFSLGRPSILCNAIALAMGYMLKNFNVTFTFMGKKVVSFGTANVAVNNDYTQIVPTIGWEKSTDPNDWECDFRSHTNEHKVVYFRLEGSEKGAVLDFFGPLYEIYSKRKTCNGEEHPFFMSMENHMKEYTVKEIIFPIAIENSLAEQRAAIAKTHDIFPVAVDSYMISLAALFKDLRVTQLSKIQ
jgi:hypothetical protein